MTYRTGLIVAVLSVAGLVASPTAGVAIDAKAAGPAPVAFARNGDLFTLRLGGGIRRVTDTAALERMPAWAPDHRRLAFVAWERRLLWLDTHAGVRHDIVRVPARFEGIDAVAWSPDGRRLAFSTTRDAGGRFFRLCGQVWLVRPDGGGLVRILGGQEPVTGLGWSPDGRRLFASSEFPNGTEECQKGVRQGVLRFRADGSHLSVVRDTAASQLDVASNGRHIVYRGWLRTCHACGEIWKIRVGGHHAHVIAMPPHRTYGLYQPRFSPSGRRVVVLAGGARRGVWIVRSDGSHLHRVLGGVDWVDW